MIFFHYWFSNFKFQISFFFYNRKKKWNILQLFWVKHISAGRRSAKWISTDDSWLVCFLRFCSCLIRKLSHPLSFFWERGLWIKRLFWAFLCDCISEIFSLFCNSRLIFAESHFINVEATLCVCMAFGLLQRSKLFPNWKILCAAVERSRKLKKLEKLFAIELWINRKMQV